MIEKIKKLRAETGAGILDIKQALNKCHGDIDKAKRLLEKQGLAKANKKSERITNEGLILSYIHANKKVGAMVEIRCETDFVARTEEFQKLAKEVAMQVAAMDPSSIKELMSQDYIRDPEKRIEDLIKESIAKFGENVRLMRFVRYELGEENE